MRKLVTVIAFLLGGLGVLTAAVASVPAVVMSATIVIILAILAFVCLAWEE